MPRPYDIIVLMITTPEDVTSFKVSLMTKTHKYNEHENNEGIHLKDVTED